MTGESTIIRKRTNGATVIEKRFAFFFAAIFGADSQNTMMIAVMQSVMRTDTQPLYFSPSSAMPSTVTIESEPMLQRLLPMRMAESAFSYLSITLQAIPAARFPSSAADARRIRLADESAISDAEKNAEPQSSTSIKST